MSMASLGWAVALLSGWAGEARTCGTCREAVVGMGALRRAVLFTSR